MFVIALIFPSSCSSIFSAYQTMTLIRRNSQQYVPKAVGISIQRESFHFYFSWLCFRCISAIQSWTTSSSFFGSASFEREETKHFRTIRQTHQTVGRRKVTRKVLRNFTVLCLISTQTVSLNLHLSFRCNNTYCECEETRFERNFSAG